MESACANPSQNLFRLSQKVSRHLESGNMNLLPLICAIVLAWDRSPDPFVTGYILYSGPSSGHYTNSVDVGNITSVTVQAVTNRTYYVVTCYNNVGLESDPSNEISWPLSGLTTNLLFVQTVLWRRTNILDTPQPFLTNNWTLTNITDVPMEYYQSQLIGIEAIRNIYKLTNAPLNAPPPMPPLP